VLARSAFVAALPKLVAGATSAAKDGQ
jgi:hypothetical protein